MLPNDFGCSKLVWRFYELIAIVMVIFYIAISFVVFVWLWVWWMWFGLSGRQTQTSGLAR